MTSQSIRVENLDIFKTTCLFLLPGLERNLVKMNVVKLKAVFQRGSRTLYSFTFASRSGKCSRICWEGQLPFWTHSHAQFTLFCSWTHHFFPHHLLPFLMVFLKDSELRSLFPIRSAVMFNVRYPLDWPPVGMLSLNITEYVFKVFLDGFSIWIGGLSRVDCPPPCELASTNLLQVE